MQNSLDFTIIHFDTLDSTQLYVRSNAAKMASLSVVCCDFQTAGKGQGDHVWQSEKGQNLMFSLLVRYGQNGIQELSASCQKSISNAVAYSVIDYLCSKGVKGAWMKEPNDVWVYDKKICGILIEHRVRGGMLLESIIGVGLNLNQRVFPEVLPNPVSLGLITGTDYDPAAELPLLLEHLGRRLSF